MRRTTYSLTVAMSLVVAGCAAVAPKVDNAKATPGGAVADANTQSLRMS